MSQQPSIETIRLLLVHESQDEAELLLNDLRKAGKAARGEIVRDEASLVTHLKSHEWDLLLARPGVGKCTLARIAELAGKHASGVPLIVLADAHDSASIVAGLKAGAQDVVPRDDTEHLVLVLNRELGNLAIRREMYRLEADLRETQKRTELLMDTARDAVAYVTDGMHVQANDAYLELFGYSDADDLAGVPVMDLVAEENHRELKDLLRKQASAKDGETHEITCKCLHSDGHGFEATMSFSPANYDGEPCTQILIRTEAAGGVSDEEMEARLKAMSLQDGLTGLHNRQYFMEQADTAVAQAKRGKTYTLFFIQIDNFTQLRTSVGIGGADTVLKEVSTLLRTQVPEKAGILARFGDDVFAALVGSGDMKKARTFGEQIRSGIADHLFEVQKKTLQVTVSIGATIVDKDVPNGQEALTRAADAGLRVRQQNEAGNGVYVHSPDDFIDANTDSGMARHLQAALEKNQFALYWQPILNLEDNAEETYEVLLRLPFKDKELQPAEFLQAASAGNLNTKIDRWVILHALKMLADHQAKGHKSRIMVTLTSDSLADTSLVQWLGVALKAARSDGKSLILQFTENDAGTYLKAAKAFCTAVQSMGISTAITRFGSAGTGAPKVLMHLPEVLYVKLDGSFVQEIGSEAGKKSISQIIKDAKSHSRKVIASHVESAPALQVLWGFGIDYIEGYYVSPPLSAMTYSFSEA